MATMMHFRLMHKDIWHRVALVREDPFLLDLIKKIVSDVTGIDELQLFWTKSDGMYPLDDQAQLEKAMEFADALALITNDMACVKLAVQPLQQQPAAPAAAAAASTADSLQHFKFEFEGIKHRFVVSSGVDDMLLLMLKYIKEVTGSDKWRVSWRDSLNLFDMPLNNIMDMKYACSYARQQAERSDGCIHLVLQPLQQLQQPAAGLVQPFVDEKQQQVQEFQQLVDFMVYEALREARMKSQAMVEREEMESCFDNDNNTDAACHPTENDEDKKKDEKELDPIESQDSTRPETGGDAIEKTDKVAKLDETAVWEETPYEHGSLMPLSDEELKRIDDWVVAAKKERKRTKSGGVVEEESEASDDVADVEVKSEYCWDANEDESQKDSSDDAANADEKTASGCCPNEVESEELKRIDDWLAETENELKRMMRGGVVEVESEASDDVADDEVKSEYCWGDEDSVEDEDGVVSEYCWNQDEEDDGDETMARSPPKTEDEVKSEYCWSDEELSRDEEDRDEDEAKSDYYWNASENEEKDEAKSEYCWDDQDSSNLKDSAALGGRCDDGTASEYCWVKEDFLEDSSEYEEEAKSEYCWNDDYKDSDASGEEDTDGSEYCWDVKESSNDSSNSDDEVNSQYCWDVNEFDNLNLDEKSSDSEYENIDYL